MRETEEVVKRVRERTEQYETLQDNNTSHTGGTPKKRVQIVLLAACLAVLSLGVFSATAGRGYINRLLELFGTENDTETIKDSIIRIGQSVRFGRVTVTIEDIVADAGNMWIEISTDYEVDAPDGWLSTDKTLIWFSLNVDGQFIFPKDCITSSGWCCTPFVRDGKLWYLFYGYISRDYEGKYCVDLGKVPVRLTIIGHEWREGGREYTHTFEWTNNYTSKRDMFSVNADVGNCTITEIDLTVTELEIVTTAEDPFPVTLDYVKLDDGTVLRFTEADKVVTRRGRQLIRNGWDGPKAYDYYYSLITDFHEEGVDFRRVVPYDRITALSVNGIEIPVR